METAKSNIDPCPNAPGVDGHGEGVVCVNSETGSESQYYYAYAGKRVPRDKAAAVRSEGPPCGRVRGDIDYMIVAFNGTDFTVLESVVTEGIRSAMRKYKGMTAAQSIQLAESEHKMRQEWIDNLKKCGTCERPVILLVDNQPDDRCARCFSDGNKSQQVSG